MNIKGRLISMSLTPAPTKTFGSSNGVMSSVVVGRPVVTFSLEIDSATDSRHFNPGDLINLYFAEDETKKIMPLSDSPRTARDASVSLGDHW